MKAIVTVCDKGYSGLLPHWLEAIRNLTRIPVYVLALEDSGIGKHVGCSIVSVSSSGNPFPRNFPDHACAEKQRIFMHLPQEVTHVLFLDVDVLALRNFWDDSEYFADSEQAFVACKDLFVGYKEKMEEEFRPFNLYFRMKFFEDGSYHYFNTGVFFASRVAHESLFSDAFSIWKKYVKQTGKFPSIFDQNVFNYCLIAFNVPVLPMPVHNNCLRQYEKRMEKGCLFLEDNREVNAFHFNGGDAELKLKRWNTLLREMELSREKGTNAEHGSLPGLI